MFIFLIVKIEIDCKDNGLVIFVQGFFHFFQLFSTKLCNFLQICPHFGLFCKFFERFFAFFTFFLHNSKKSSTFAPAFDEKPAAMVE